MRDGGWLSPQKYAQFVLVLTLWCCTLILLHLSESLHHVLHQLRLHSYDLCQWSSNSIGIDVVVIVVVATLVIVLGDMVVLVLVILVIMVVLVGGTSLISCSAPGVNHLVQWGGELRLMIEIDEKKKE